jgi:hypothetical protein
VLGLRDPRLDLFKDARRAGIDEDVHAVCS